MSAVTVFCSPSRYTQGKNATAALGAEMTGLGLAEQCRDVQAPLEMAGLMRDVREMMNSPLESYGTFIDDLLEIIAEMPDMLRYSTGTVHADPVILYIHVDNQLVERISKQVMKLAKG